MPPFTTPQENNKNGTNTTAEDEMFLTMEVDDLKELEEKAKTVKNK